MKGHAGFEFGQVTPAKAHRTFSPVRRIAESDGISGTAVFLDSVFFQDIEKGYRDVFTAVSRTGLSQSGFQFFQDGLVRIQKFVGGLTEEDRTAEGDMITPVATCNFKKVASPFFIGRLSQVRWDAVALVPGGRRGGQWQGNHLRIPRCRGYWHYKFPQPGRISACPARFGGIPAQMKTIMDATGGLWQNGKLVGKKAGVFQST